MRVKLGAAQSTKDVSNTRRNAAFPNTTKRQLKHLREASRYNNSDQFVEDRRETHTRLLALGKEANELFDLLSYANPPVWRSPWGGTWRPGKHGERAA